MTEPTTEAGRALVRRVLGLRVTDEDVVAIEREAAEAEREACCAHHGRCIVCTVGPEPLYVTDPDD